ncbi:MAG: 23S rRNA pseudouridine(955/2504/2580) synthase RluC [Pseudomonadales bacterium]
MENIQVRYVSIDDSQAGQRLDNFLFTELKSIPKSRVYRMLRSGEVRVNKRRAKQTYRLLEGDNIRIPPVRVPSDPNEKRPLFVSEALAENLKAAIILETDDLLVINKPAGLAVHGGSGITLGLIEAMRVLRPECRRMELVHRLDRDTSGCLMIAKNRKTLVDLHQQLQNKTLSKRYLALVFGRWPKSLRRVDAPLQKNELSSGERMVKVSQDGKASSTLFKVLEWFDGVSLVEASPVTGRTHQIRVHAAFKGHAIAGDAKYAADAANKEARQRGLQRLFLHASELRLTVAGEPLTVKAELDDSLKMFLDKIRK